VGHRGRRIHIRARSRGMRSPDLTASRRCFRSVGTASQTTSGRGEAPGFRANRVCWRRERDARRTTKGGPATSPVLQRQRSRPRGSGGARTRLHDARGTRPHACHITGWMVSVPGDSRWARSAAVWASSSSAVSSPESMIASRARPAIVNRNVW